MNIRQQFDAELAELSAALIRMGAMATENLRKSMEALDHNDKRLAKEVIEGDRAIDEMEREIEQRCLRLLLKQQPVAGDLRKISTAIKMITDIERIGDGAADIAEISLHLEECSFPEILKLILAMAKEASEMAAASIEAYVKEDLELAQATIDRDDVVDNCFQTIRAELASRLSKSQHEMDEIIDYLMITKYLERQGDHAVNICEWVQFYKTGIHKHERIV